jgi:predicted RNase H-like HicB family nuclease
MRPSVYSEESMQTIRILHHHEPGYGWSFDSPDIPGMIGGTDSFDEKHAEEAAKFTLTCIAEEQGRPAPSELKFEHYVPAHVAVTA